MAEKFESNIVTYTALLSHQQRTRRKEVSHNKDVKGKVLGIREQKRHYDNKKGTIITISVNASKNQVLDFLNKTVIISKDKKQDKK